MAVVGTTGTEAQRAQIPPALRRFVQDTCVHSSGIERYSPENEVSGRGFKIRARSIDTFQLPDQFEVYSVHVTDDGDLIAYIME